MAETEAAEESVEGGADGEQGEEYVAETETSQTEGGEEGEGDENNTTYNTDVVEEEAPTQVDPDAATLEDIFGLDEDEEEPEQEQIPEDIPDDLDEIQYATRQQQVIGSPLRLVTNPLPTPPEDTLVVRVKLPNIIGIQSKPYTHQSLEEELSSMFDDEDDENRKKKHGVPESQIRWRHVEGTKDVRESNARVVRWSDGSMHLMLGNELLDMTMHDLHAEHLYLYARQPGFLHSQGRLKKKVVIRPASLDNKLHQKLSMSLAERNQKVSKVKLVTTTADPEVEKARREKAEEERIRRAQGETAAKNRLIRSYGVDAAYLEQTGEYDEPPASSQPLRRDRERERERVTYRDNSRNLEDFIVDDEEDDEALEDKRASKKKRRQEVEEDTDRLMNAKRDLSPEPKKSRKEKEKRKVRKGAREEEAEESKEEEKVEEEAGDTQMTEEKGGGGEEEEEEVNIVKRPTKARRGVIVDDDEAET